MDSLRTEISSKTKGYKSPWFWFLVQTMKVWPINPLVSWNLKLEIPEKLSEITSLWQSSIYSNVAFWFFNIGVIGHLNTNNFIFLFFDFLILYWFYFLISFIFLLDNEEACDTVVTWQVTWCDVIGLEHGGRIWKMTSGHMYTTWWPWVGNKVNMRL